MPNLLQPESLASRDDGDQDAVRKLNRSPHPYHHHNSELPFPADRFDGRRPAARQQDNLQHQPDSKPSSNGYAETGTRARFSRETTPASESGTEADDEHFLRGLPAPRTRLHKGLRDRNENISSVNTPISSPAILEEEESYLHVKKVQAIEDFDRRQAQRTSRRNKVILRRLSEAAILGTLGFMVWTNPRVTVWHELLVKGREGVFFYQYTFTNLTKSQ